MHVDATAAKGMIDRMGVIEHRHIDTDVLWVQEQEPRRALPLTNVLGTEDIADLMTKNIRANVINGYAQSMNLDSSSADRTSLRNCIRRL